MVKIRTLVPLTHPTTDEEFAADTEVDVAEDVAAAWRAAGKISLVSAEQASAEGHYSDVVGREDVAPLDTAGQKPGPQADDEDEPKSGRKGKK